MMKRELQSFYRLIGAALLLAILPVGVLAREGDPPKQSGEKVTDHGRIDWEKGTLYATGMGIISDQEPNEAKAYLRARSFAKMDALRNLLMLIDHVKIDSQTLGSDFEAKSDEIRAEIRGIVRGAQVVSERRRTMGNGTILEVTVSTALYGDRGIAQVFVPEIARRDREVVRPPATDGGGNAIVTPAPQIQLAPPSATDPAGLEPLTPPRPNEPITSVIIDTRGQKIERCMAPKIRRTDGSEIWGKVNVDPDWVIEHGIVVYAHSLSDARRNERAGGNPLMLRAVGRGGGAFCSDPILSDADADQLLQANQRYGFLPKFRVIFVVEPGQ